jgi:hypothetical protein
VRADLPQPRLSGSLGNRSELACALPSQMELAIGNDRFAAKTENFIIFWFSA